MVAFEAYEKGFLGPDQTGGLKLEWGNPDAMLKLIHLIANREGIGELLAEGVKIASERLDPRYLAGELVPNEDLAGFYAAAGIVLNDHWTDMQREGFLSNRLYDASAAGAFVISDAIDGLREEFDGGIVAYHGRDELCDLVEAYLADPGARAACAARARAAVLARHTFAHRARAIVDAVAPLEAARPPAVVPWPGVP